MDKQQKLDQLKQQMKKDGTLPLKKSATNLVFGDGNPDAEILFIGEGPGYWEDQKGLPFVGAAGAFLNQLLRIINIPREEVFITNIIHFRPPENRDPLPSEIEAFQKYLDKIIEIVDPKLIVTLGRFSMAKFLPGVTISSVHGKVKKVEWKGKEVIILPMYHPAAGLRSTDIKIRITEDFKQIPGILENIRQTESKTEEEEKKNVEQIQLL
ncbi:hypothetical protein A2Z22_02440 [Candidatus Woesebacteria bacterium RBG_16_34_12]|uniref:Type-4 uracil-DNA glycosylase n=1 Tax=Candidatus Woesebacteria bacterium RBG_16_34_12 TaxID=1802480 RepID=A0A1F7X9K4_9BACT|nr:MAG: hypothetical protein A2Z22_02440 [Candidatus Woesebacteria bacterium RBG_16_34_12]